MLYNLIKWREKMSPIEKELIETIRNSKDTVKTFEYALSLILANLQKPLPFEQQAPAFQAVTA